MSGLFRNGLDYTRSGSCDRQADAVNLFLDSSKTFIRLRKITLANDLFKTECCLRGVFRCQIEKGAFECVSCF